MSALMSAHQKTWKTPIPHLFNDYDMLFALYNPGPTFDILEGSKWQEFSKNKIK